MEQYRCIVPVDTHTWDGNFSSLQEWLDKINPRIVVWESPTQILYFYFQPNSLFEGVFDTANIGDIITYDANNLILYPCTPAEFAVEFDPITPEKALLKNPVYAKLWDGDLDYFEKAFKTLPTEARVSVKNTASNSNSILWIAPWALGKETPVPLGRVVIVDPALGEIFSLTPEIFAKQYSIIKE